jgi:hypothetical protein
MGRVAVSEVVEADPREAGCPDERLSREHLTTAADRARCLSRMTRSP